MILIKFIALHWIISCCFFVLQEEEEEEAWTDDENAIKAYLENDDPLPNDLLEKIVGEWWNEEPFK